MKLTAIMLIINSFFANQQGVEVVNKIIEPIKHISADAPLSRVEFDEEAKAISHAAAFCKEHDIITQLNEANARLMGYYQDIDSFDALLAQMASEVGMDLVEISTVIDAIISSARNDLQNKLTEFETEILKRGRDIQLLDDVRLLKLVVTKTSRFFSEFRTLLAQATVTNVELTRSFLSEDEVDRIAKLSENHFKGLPA